MSQHDGLRRGLNRRNFIRASATAAGAFALGALSGCGAPPATATPAAAPAKPPEAPTAASAPKPTEAPKSAAAQPTQAPAAAPTTAPAAKSAAAGKTVNLSWWCYPFWNGITGKEVGPQYTPYDWPKLKAKEYAEKHPGVTVAIEPIDFEAGKQKVEVAIISKTWPDLMQEDFAVIRKRMTQGVLEPVDSFLSQEDKDDYLFLDVCVFQGKRYAWPFRANAGPLFVNRAIFKERNALDLLPKGEKRGWTWDEFLKAVQATTFDRDGDKKKDVYGFGLHFNEDPGGYHRTLFLWNFGARAFSEDGSKCVINSPEALMGLQYLLDLQDKHDALMPGGLTLNRAKMREAFMQGRAALYPDNGDLKLIIDRAIGGGTIKKESMDVWPVRAPSLPGKDPLMFSDQSGFCVFKQTDDDKRAAAMDFCHFCTDKENIKAVTGNSLFPARKSPGDLYPGDPYQGFLQTLTPLSASKDTGHPYYFDYRHQETFMFQAVLSHQKPPKEALDDLAKETNKVLKEAGLQ